MKYLQSASRSDIFKFIRECTIWDVKKFYRFKGEDLKDQLQLLIDICKRQNIQFLK